MIRIRSSVDIDIYTGVVLFVLEFMVVLACVLLFVLIRTSIGINMIDMNISISIEHENDE